MNDGNSVKMAMIGTALLALSQCFLPGEDVDGDTPPQSETYLLKFEPHYGKLGNESLNPGGQAVLIVMLCETSDPSCESPVVMREVREDETDAKIIQASYGPTIRISDLPEGRFKLMIMADSPRSRERGYGWEDSFETQETAWGGVASETDGLLAEADRTVGIENLPPKTMEVTLKEDAPVDLGVVYLAHLHERDISAPLRSESGLLAVAAESGLRLIDLETGQLRESHPGFYDHIAQDDDGEVLEGAPCGLIQGEGQTVFVLYKTTKGGFALPVNVATGQQVYGEKRVLFDGDQSDTPCSGVFHEYGDETFLFVTNMRASTLAEAAAGIWYAPLSDLSIGNVNAGRIGGGDALVLDLGVASMAPFNDTIYLSIGAELTDNQAPEECRGRHCIFKASLDARGRPDLFWPPADEYDLTVVDYLYDGMKSERNDIECPIELSEPSFAHVVAASFHDGRDLLFVGLCSKIAVYDLADGSRLDYNGSIPGRLGIDGTYFGHYFASSSLSPDRETLWFLPRKKSSVPFVFQRGVGENAKRDRFDRFMALPVDLSAGDRPDLDPAFVRVDLDRWEGVPNFGDEYTPREDPGVDVSYAWYVGYKQHWYDASTVGGSAIFGAASLPTGPAIAVSSRSLFVRGGLGTGSDLMVCDQASARAVVFPRDDAPFYRVWTDDRPTSVTMGFDLRPEGSSPMATYGVFFFPSGR